MPFFTNSSGLVLNQSHFSEIGRDFNFNVNLTGQEPAARDMIAQLLRMHLVNHDNADDRLTERKRSTRSSDGLTIVDIDEVDLRKELIKGSSYRMHSASHGGRIVAIKVFEGPRAKQDWRVNVAFSKKFLHPNLLKMVGASEETSETPFVVFRGISEKNMQAMMARALRADLNKSVLMSMKAVKGLAAGLSYMKSQNIPINNLGWMNFNIFAGDGDEIVIATHPPTKTRGTGLESQSSDIESEAYGVEALDNLCKKLFSEVNSILYDDSPERLFDRLFDTYDTNGRLGDDQGDPEDTSPNISEIAIAPSNAVKRPMPKILPRREIWWRLDLDSNKNRSLDSIARRFDNYLDCFAPESSSSDSFLRRITASKDASFIKETSHQCPGYLREEISLTSDVSTSAIISYEYPSPSEVCSVCGQVVQYKALGQDSSSSNAEGPSSNTERPRSSKGPSENMEDPRHNAEAPRSNALTTSAIPPQPWLGSENILFYVKALYDYTADIDGDISFQAGDIMAVISTQDDGWWYSELVQDGEVKGKGFVPSNFVVLITSFAPQGKKEEMERSYSEASARRNETWQGLVF